MKALVVSIAWVLLLALACGVDGGGEATPTPGGWIERTPMPTPRAEVAGAALNGKIYVIGGQDATGNALAVVEVYDPATDSWAAAANLSVPRHHAAAATVDGRLFVVGGYQSAAFASVEAPILEYDAESDGWIERAPMLTPRAALALAVLDGRIYAIGGTTGRENNDTVATVEVYDPSADAWSVAPPLKAARDHLVAGVIEGEIYVVTGRAGVNYGDPVTTIEKLNFAIGAWENVGEMSEEWSGGAGAEYDGCLWFAGGSLPQRVSPFVFALCAPGVVRQRLSMGLQRHGLALASVDNVLYAIGGSTGPVLMPTAANTSYELALTSTPPPQ